MSVAAIFRAIFFRYLFGCLCYSTVNSIVFLGSSGFHNYGKPLYRATPCSTTEHNRARASPATEHDSSLPSNTVLDYRALSSSSKSQHLARLITAEQHRALLPSMVPHCRATPCSTTKQRQAPLPSNTVLYYRALPCTGKPCYRA
ncbi:hypothetical protein MRX96_054410 [Rhipicephalus microplus]